MHATLVYPHQLFAAPAPHLTPEWPVFLIEEPLFLTEFPTHPEKCLLHRRSLYAYREELVAAGYTVTYLEVAVHPSTEAVLEAIAKTGATTWHVVDTTDTWLERRLATFAKVHDITLIRYESPLFILPKAEAVERYQKSKRFMARFYQGMRQREGILLTADGLPEGGQWSFDADNRQKLPKGIVLPHDLSVTTPPSPDDAAWLNALPGTRYGSATGWVPYTREAAQEWLTVFLRERLTNFGPYEDAIDTEHARLFHSVLTPILNIGLLTPDEVISATLAHHKEHPVPLASLEGFVRQIIGWREFIRASYEAEGTAMRSKNFFKHARALPTCFWDGTTGLEPADAAITRALRFGYTHHIERLMVLGNLMLLSGIKPEDTYTWFMAMYVDAYDWVMVPNVYGMSQFADGGSFATKPYISGGSYLKKMSTYPTGDWEATWTALYWHFIETHLDVFSKNHRLSMMPKLWAKMPEATKNAHRETARAFLKQLT